MTDKKPFLAYDKIPWQQHELYQTYARSERGLATLELARSLLKDADDETRDLNGQLRRTLIATQEVPVEFELFAVRNPSVEGFDLYYVDEDDLLLGFALDVSADRAIQAALTLFDEASTVRPGLFIDRRSH